VPITEIDLLVILAINVVGVALVGAITVYHRATERRTRREAEQWLRDRGDG